MAAVAILATSWALTLARTVLVLDAVLLGGSITGGLARATGYIRSHTCFFCRTSSLALEDRPLGTSSSRRPQGVGAAGSSIVRSLHRKLLVVHATAALGGGAALLKYVLPVSDTSCKVSHQFMIGFLLLFDASLVTFLLAKVDVTNGHRTLGCCERGVIWLSRAYAWIYLPFAAIYVSVTHEGGTNEDFAVLLALFLRPLRMRHEDTQSGGAIYRGVVIRNVTCTGAISIAYAIATVVMVTALLNETDEDDKVSKIAVIAPVVNAVVVLFLIEISLPLGFISCRKALTTDSANSRTSSQAGKSSRTSSAPRISRRILAAVACTATPPDVVPGQEEEEVAEEP